MKSKIFLTYDYYGNLIFEESERWNGNFWEKSSRTMTTYNDKNSPTYVISESFIDNIWKPWGRSIFSYNYENNTYEQLDQELVGGIWFGMTKIITEKFDYGNHRETIFFWRNDTWTIYQRRNYQYDNEGNLVVYYEEEWDGKNWLQKWETKFFYRNNTDLYLRYTESIDGENRVVVSRRSLEYDSDNNMTEEIYEEMSENKLQFDEKYVYQYENNRRSYGQAYKWNGDIWEQTNGYLRLNESSNRSFSNYGTRMKVYYKENSKISYENENILLQNYPNPFNKATRISYYIKQSGHVTISVYDILGNKIKDLENRRLESGRHDLIFEGNDLSTGVYIYRIETPDYNECRKMILLK